MKLKAIEKYQSAKTFRELFQILTWEEIEYIAFVPVFLMLLSPFFQFVTRFFVIGLYKYLIEDVNLFASVFGVAVYLLCLGKNAVEQKKISYPEHLTYIFFSIFVLLILISDTVNGWTEKALTGTWRGEGAFTFIRYILIYFFCGSRIRNPKLKRLTARTFVLTGTATSIAVLIHLWFIPMEVFITSRFGWVQGMFSNPNHYGYYLNLLTLVSAGLIITDEPSRKWKITYWICYAINTTVLFFSETFGCVLACLAGLILQIIMQYLMTKKINKKAVLLIAVYFVLNLFAGIFARSLLTDILQLFGDFGHIAKKDDAVGEVGSGRGKLWVLSVRRICENPLFGLGTEGITEDLLSISEVDRPHNEYLQYAVFYGIPAVICYIAGIFCIYLRGLKNRLHLDAYTAAFLTASFGYCVSAFFGNTMYYTAPLFFCLLGLSYQTSE